MPPTQNGDTFSNAQKDVRSHATREIWRAHEQFTDAHGTWVSHRLALQLMHGHVRYAQLRRWRADGCSHLNGRKLRTRRHCKVLGHRPRYYHLGDLEEILSKIESLQTGPQDPKIISATDAARAMGISVRQLTHEPHCGLTVQYYQTLRRDGRRCRKPGFLPDEIKAWNEKHRQPIPAGRLPLKRATRVAGVSETRMLEWLDTICPYLGRPLDAIEGRVPRRRGSRAVRKSFTTFLVAQEDAKAIRAALARNEPPPHIDAQGCWVGWRQKSRDTGQTYSQLYALRRQGKLPAKQIEAHDRWSWGGKRWVYLGNVDALPQSAASPTVPPKRQPGRHRSEQTWELYKFCWERRQAGDKLSQILIQAQKLFRDKMNPKTTDQQTVALYIRRYKKSLQNQGGQNSPITQPIRSTIN